MKIPQSKIDEILTSVDIIDVISKYTTLKKAGKNFSGRCPFHQEKTPSFSVSQEKGVYHCFGCGKSGNIFTFVMDIDKVSYIDAVRILANKANIRIDFEEGNFEEDRNKIELLYEIHKRAARYYYNNLNSEDGGYAYEYLYSRGLKDETIKKFGLGFSLRYKDNLTNILLKDFKPQAVIESGLAINTGNNELRDRFRGRLMIPIFSESDRVVAFGGRKLFEDDLSEAKYINSPETKIYNKSRILFGLNLSKSSIKSLGYVIIVEGYMDLIALNQFGFYNVVATSGTSMTDMHIKILSRYTDECTMLFDGDIAGENAVRRGIDILLTNDMKTSVIILPKGEDPDTFLRNQGKDKFEHLLYNRKTVINYLVEKTIDEKKLNDPDSKGKFIRDVIKLLAKIKDPIKAELYLKDIAEQTGIYEQLLKKELDKIKRQGSKGFSRQYDKPEEEQISLQKAAEIKPLEKLLLKLLLEGKKETKEYIIRNLEIDFIENPVAARIINLFYKNIKKPENWNSAYIMNSLQDPVINSLVSEIIIEEEMYRSKDDLVEAKFLIKKFQVINLNHQINDLKNKIKTLPKTSDKDIKKLQSLLKKKLQLDKPD